MREPRFWYRRRSLLAGLLSPLSALYSAVTAARMARRGLDPGVPVICVGNYHMGGAGKTPTTLKLVEILRGLGERPVVLSRGYGGRLRGPVEVDPQRHTAEDVGDEPLMMAHRVPVVVSRDRVEGAALARALAASVIVMDDGFQNPALAKHVAMIVIDGARGAGNARVFPAGPLRAPLGVQQAATDALVVIGDGDAADGIAADVGAAGRPVLRARLIPEAASLQVLAGARVLAFAGIGDPARFFASLRASGVDVVQECAFADHHPFTADELGKLAGAARRQGLRLVTTEKDLMRLGAASSALGAELTAFAVTLAFADEARLRGFLLERLNAARAPAR